MESQIQKCKKAAFANEMAANFYIDKLKRTSTRSVKPVRAYLCESCLSWHITSVIGHENMQMIYKQREIANLKEKILNLKTENEILKKKLGLI